MQRRSFVIALGSGAALSALGAAYLLFMAITAASTRYWYCGPTSLDHVEQSCRVGTMLLYAFYGTGMLALVLGVIAARMWAREIEDVDTSTAVIDADPLG